MDSSVSSPVSISGSAPVNTLVSTSGGYSCEYFCKCEHFPLPKSPYDSKSGLIGVYIYI